MKIKNFKAVTTRKSIIPNNRRVILQPVGAGLFLIVQAETDKGELKSTAPFTLFLQRADFLPSSWVGGAQ